MGEVAQGGPLSDFVTLQRGNTYKGALLGRPGPYLLGLACIQRNGGFKSDNLKTYGGDSDPRIIVGPGDLIVSLKDVTQAADLLGSVVRVPDHIKIGRLTQDTVKLVFKSDTSRDYIYWILRTAEARQHCRSLATGTTNLGLARADFLSFVVPPLTLERQHLLELLSALDDKIELNRRMNETLEASARALFRDWFVDFGPTRAKAEDRPPYLAPDLWSLFPNQMGNDGVPAGWTVQSIYEFADVVYGAPFASARFNQHGVGRPMARIRDLPSHAGGQFTDEVHKKEFLIHPGSIVVGMDGEFRAYLWHGVPTLMNQRICAFVPKASHLRGFVWNSIEPLLAAQESSAIGTTVIHLGKKDIDRFTAVAPPQPVKDAFGKLVEPLIDMIVENGAESRTLAETRDALLPKLMSGEIRVRDAEALVAECV